MQILFLGARDPVVDVSQIVGNGVALLRVEDLVRLGDSGASRLALHQGDGQRSDPARLHPAAVQRFAEIHNQRVRDPKVRPVLEHLPRAVLRLEFLLTPRLNSPSVLPSEYGVSLLGVLMSVSLGVKTRASLWSWLIGALNCFDPRSMKNWYSTS